MRRNAALAVATVLAVVGVAETVQAQDVDRRAPRFDIGIYGGGAYTTDWYESRTLTADETGTFTQVGEEEGYNFGTTWAMGAAGTLYFSPAFGARLHYGYVPSELPTADDEEFEDGLPVNNHFYDLSLVFRPWADRVGGGFLTQTYLFLGGGGLTSNIASSGSTGVGPGNCEPGAFARGACYSLDEDKATVGQGTVGLGIDLLSLTANLGVFAELASHIYDSPVHVGDNFMGDDLEVGVGEPFVIADDRIAATTRLVAGVKLAVGNLLPPPPPPRPAPAPPMAPPPPPPPPADRQIMVCVVDGTMLREVTAMYNPTTGDTTVSGQPFSSAYPTRSPEYAAGTSWYIQSDSLMFEGDEYVRFGVTRTVPHTQLMRAGDFEGTNVFVETGAMAPYSVIYVPVRPGCEFQPYQMREVIRVRG
jgi:hypothetical protein